MDGEIGETLKYGCALLMMCSLFWYVWKDCICAWGLVECSLNVKENITCVNTKGGGFYALIEKIFGRIQTEKTQKIAINKGWEMYYRLMLSRGYACFHLVILNWKLGVSGNKNKSNAIGILKQCVQKSKKMEWMWVNEWKKYFRWFSPIEKMKTELQSKCLMEEWIC